MTRRRADETEVTEKGHIEIHPIYREKFADRGMSHDFAERPCNLFLENRDDYSKYLVLHRPDRVTGYRNSLVASRERKET